jgi:hypothetical protein
MIFYLIEKWIITPGCILLGISWCYYAYLKRRETISFHVGDLLGYRRFSDKSKQQLFIEGIFLIAAGLLGIILFAQVSPSKG